MPEEKVLLTTEGLEKLKNELEHLREVHRPEVLERLQRAKELSDTVDNAEYDEAKNEQAFVEGRIMWLERTIKHAEVIPVEKKRPAYVRFGSKVKVRNSDGAEGTYTIVGRTESNPAEGKISNESPVGKALLGRHVGEEIEIQVPKGLTKLKIVTISRE
ncbi:transcription elongation factor GreA [Dehalococcoidia bacterium]|nr:transcription elongation factor GreA [Dehalococcoidia bacterium]